jgi:glycerol-3-phosphate acyltransferase PlsX
MNIAIDMMGGDFAPLETAIGIAQYFKQPDNRAQLLLLGNEPDILPLVELYQIPPDRITIVHAPEVIGYHDHPVKALKEKQQSSIAVGFGMLAQGKADAFISAGNTGAMLVGSMFSLKPLD